MTPKEKALEIVQNITDEVFDTIPNIYADDAFGLAQNVSIIYIEFMMDELLNWAGGSMDNGWDTKRFDYWQQVKNEIPKL